MYTQNRNLFLFKPKIIIIKVIYGNKINMLITRDDYVSY